MNLEKYGDYEVITPDLIKEAMQSNTSVFELVKEMNRMAWENVFSNDCSLKDMGLLLMAVGMSAYQHGKKNEGKTEHSPGPKMDLDLSALEGLKEKLKRR